MYPNVTADNAEIIANSNSHLPKTSFSSIFMYLSLEPFGLTSYPPTYSDFIPTVL